MKMCPHTIVLIYIYAMNEPNYLLHRYFSGPGAFSLPLGLPDTATARPRDLPRWPVDLPSQKGSMLILVRLQAKNFFMSWTVTQKSTQARSALYAVLSLGKTSYIHPHFLLERPNRYCSLNRPVYMVKLEQ
jgi:hypothetical protein